MKRGLVVAAALVAVAGCAGGGAEGPAWYQSGDVTYDNLRAAHDACVAKGGKFQLKSGGDPTFLGDYDCKGAKES